MDLVISSAPKMKESNLTTFFLAFQPSISRKPQAVTNRGALLYLENQFVV